MAVALVAGVSQMAYLWVDLHRAEPTKHLCRGTGGPAAFPLVVRSADAFARTEVLVAPMAPTGATRPVTVALVPPRSGEYAVGWSRSAPSPSSYGRTMMNSSPSVDQLSGALRVVADLVTGVGPAPAQSRSSWR
jgi:hypothetical protein